METNIDQYSSKPKHSGTGAFSDNPIIERLSRTHIAVPLTILMSIAVGLLYYAMQHTDIQLAYIPFLFMSGVLFFTFLEYVLHRYLFHLKTDTEQKKVFQHKIHGLHHEFPKDKTRLAMPPILSIALTVSFFYLFYALIDTKVFAFLPGIMAGYCLYISVHYIIHIYPPPKNFFKELWINHAIHHYKDGNMAFGVSSPLWDYVFGTMPSKRPSAKN